MYNSIIKKLLFLSYLFLFSSNLFSQKTKNINKIMYPDIINQVKITKYIESYDTSQSNKPKKKNIFEMEQPPQFSCFLLLNLNKVYSSFNDSYFKRFMPEKKDYLTPSIKVELIGWPYLSKIGLEYRYDTFKTHYYQLEDDFFQEDFNDRISYQLPEISKVKLQSLIFTGGFGLHFFYFELGIGMGLMSFKNSSYYFKLKDNVNPNESYTIELLKEVENDFFFASESRVVIYSAAIIICPLLSHPEWLISFQIIHNNHASTRRPGPKSHWLYSDGSIREVQQIDSSAAPLMGIITLTYRFHLFSFGTPKAIFWFI